MTKVVMANGVFEILHYGHLLHLQAAKSLGDILVVSLTKDENVNKGNGRPVFNHDQRKEMLQSLRCVDRVIIVPDVLSALYRIKPDIFVKGPDYKGKIELEHLSYCNKHNIKIEFTDTPKFSSTEILSFYAIHYNER